MIRIICVGKIKENYFKEAILEYKKRISKYTKLEIIEINDYGLDVKTTLKKEGDEILKYIDSSHYNIVMDINGEQLDSVSLSKKVNNIFINSSTINFIVGGSYGLDERVKEKSNFRLSFSKLTFPHQLFRIILLEQLYRSFKILNNEEYHK